MLCTSSIADDVIFSHNGANGTESVTSSCLIKITRWRHESAAGPGPPGGEVCYPYCVVVCVWKATNATSGEVSGVLLARHCARLLQHGVRRRRASRTATVPHRLFVYDSLYNMTKCNKSSSTQSYAKHIDCALQNVSAR